MGSGATDEKTVSILRDREQVLNWIHGVRREDESAFVSLAKRYEPLIESLVSRFSREGEIGFGREDLRQEAMVVFYHSILTYDTEQSEVEFGLYAKICISNALVSQFRLRKRQASERITPLDGELPGDGAREDPSERLLEQERLDALWADIEANLSPFENRV
jgi:DNA-directed RNA polymerase specialized sigma24 family protein